MYSRLLSVEGVGSWSWLDPGSYQAVAVKCMELQLLLLGLFALFFSFPFMQGESGVFFLLCYPFLSLLFSMVFFELGIPGDYAMVILTAPGCPHTLHDFIWGEVLVPQVGIDEGLPEKFPFSAFKVWANRPSWVFEDMWHFEEYFKRV